MDLHPHRREPSDGFSVVSPSTSSSTKPKIRQYGHGSVPIRRIEARGLLVSHLNGYFGYLPREMPRLTAGKYLRRVREDILVNAGLPVMNPSEPPGMKRRKNGRREKYYLTDHSGLCHSFHDKNSGNLKASDGTWKQKGMSAVSASPTSGSFPSICGVKKNFVFDNQPSWNMDVYSVVDEAQSIRDELVLCHVFEDDSPDYDSKPKYPPSRYASCKGRSNDVDDLFEDFLQKRGNMVYSSSVRGPPATEVDDNVHQVLVLYVPHHSLNQLSAKYSIRSEPNLL